MLMEKIFDRIMELLYVINKKEIIIFGTGKGGSTVASILNLLNIRNYYFVDNNKEKWTENFFGVPIYNPEILLQRRKESVIVFVATVYYDAVSKQLCEYGLRENINFYNILGVNKKEKIDTIKDFQHESIIQKIFNFFYEEEKLNVLIFGDSVMSFTSRNDVNKTTLYDMIKQKVELIVNIQGIHNMGFHSAVYYLSLHALICLHKIPDIIILPINMRSFSPSWDLNPRVQWADEIEEVNRYLNFNNYNVGNLYNCNKSTEFEEFINYSSIYGNGIEGINSKFISWANCKLNDEKEIYKKYNNLYMWHYMNILNEDNRKFKLLKNLVELINKHNIKLIAYITPINYKQGEKYIGNDFVLYYKNNVKLIEKFFQKQDNLNIYFKDLSFLFSPKYFMHENDTTEHLNEYGREILSQMITHKLEDIITSKNI